MNSPSRAFGSPALSQASALFSAEADACIANAIEEIPNLFDRFPIVTLGAAHGGPREFEFLHNLLSDRTFLQQVQRYRGGIWEFPLSAAARPLHRR